MSPSVSHSWPTPSWRSSRRLARTVEQALGTKLPEYMEVVAVQDTDEKMFIVLPMQLPFETGDLSDADLEKIAGGFLDAGRDSLLIARVGLL
jgi:hypothetical protein